MCGRYYIDSEMEQELIKIVNKIDNTNKMECKNAGDFLTLREKG